MSLGGSLKRSLGMAFLPTPSPKPAALRLPHRRAPLYCSTFEFDFADKTSAGDEKCLMICQRPDRKMFDPEYQNIECSQCLLGKIYFDREIGYYCMYCGHQFSAVDMEILIEKIALKSRSAQKSGSSHKKPVIEIKELPPRKIKVGHISRDVIKSKKPDR